MTPLHGDQERARARRALRERFMPEKLRLELRLIEIETHQKAATSWGSVMGALEEERRYVQARYNQLTQREK